MARLVGVCRLWNLVMVALVFALMTLSYMVLRQESTLYQTEIREHVTQDARRLARDLRGKLLATELIADRLAKAAKTTEELSEETLSGAADALAVRHPDITSVAIAPSLRVAFVAPLEGNEATMGLNYGESPAQLASVAKAYHSRQAVLSGPVEQPDNGRGYVLRYPVFIPADETTGERFWGVISLVLNESGLLSLAPGRQSYDGEIDFALRVVGTGQAADEVFGDQSVLNRDPAVQRLALQEGNWEILAAPAEGWPAVSPNFALLLTLLTLLSAGVAAGAVWIRRLSAQRERAHKMLSNAVEALDAGFVLYDENDRLTVCNSRFAHPFGMTVEDMHPGIRYESLIRLTAQHRQPEDREKADENWIQQRLAGHVEGQEFVLKRPDQKWVKVSETRTADGFSVSVITDITEQKKAQITAEEANRQKTEFLSNVTHELRTPLTVMIGYSQILSQPGFLPERTTFMGKLDAAKIDAPDLREAGAAFDGAVTQYSQKITGSAQHMLTMVNDLLDWAEVERGTIKLEPEELAVSDIAGSVAEDLRPQAESKGLELHCDCDDSVLEADPKRLRQVLYNLVGNAIKFTDTGHVTIHAHGSGEDVRFEVSDTGCGIPEADLERVFERFQQVDGSSTRAHGGFGLGLAIARKIVAKHGGTISATSEVGRGSRFIVDLPTGVAGSSSRDDGQPRRVAAA